ncbi:DNA-binding response OmpR family regulator [Mobilisporobacter senegalensis]|uniref:Stage 0 sporulation protein A homolog n=1 Tax=Mobilisporobacter senegalensis TaxID=1329262 RepID=A0A3N1XRV6_9FIRM|nr:response regulator transcription factor [Mobilisporobacter senegalensis]ROR29365.1 DNA-binding response OmpR family regulator [Mobilisporobacter senegalensis]
MADKVLIVEDEKELAEILGEYLSVEGYKVSLAFDGEKGIEEIDDFKPDLVLLDIMLPKVDGMTICKKIRETSDIPIIMLSAKNGEMDKVICLGIGADDYVTKPFSPLELVARVKAHLRRFDKMPRTLYDKGGLQIGQLTFYKESYVARIKEKEIDFTTKEFEVLYFFAVHHNQVFSKEQIYENVWGLNEYGDISSVAVYIKRIREKLREYDLDYIKTVWGAGYKLSIME